MSKMCCCDCHDKTQTKSVCVYVTLYVNYKVKLNAIGNMSKTKDIQINLTLMNYVPLIILHNFFKNRKERVLTYQFQMGASLSKKKIIIKINEIKRER